MSLWRTLMQVFANTYVRMFRTTIFQNSLERLVLMPQQSSSAWFCLSIFDVPLINKKHEQITSKSQYRTWLKQLTWKIPCQITVLQFKFLLTMIAAKMLSRLFQACWYVHTLKLSFVQISRNATILILIWSWKKSSLFNLYLTSLTIVATFLRYCLWY